MELTDRTVVVTGGASGIGEAICHAAAAEGARRVVVVDLDGDGATAVAEAIGDQATAMRVDVGSEADVIAAIERIDRDLGPIDVLVSNAGIGRGGGVEAPTADWQASWDVNVMAHVWATRAALPSMIARGEGYLVHTASAAGLLTNLGAAPYSVTKHAVVALAEWLSITHHDEEIRVSCLCPQGVNTPMLNPTGPDNGGGAPTGDLTGEATAVVKASGVVLQPSDVARAVIEGVRSEKFLILPHPEVATFESHRADDRERWLRGMRRLWASLRSG